MKNRFLKRLSRRAVAVKLTQLLESMDDEPYLRFLYLLRKKRWLDLKHPVTFNEKLQYLKLHGYRPEYSVMSDKVEVKKYIADRIGEQYVIPLLGVWDRAEDIDFDALPKKFILKCSHDSGSFIICRDKDTLDKKWAVGKLSRAVKRDFYRSKRERSYKGIKGRILAEEYMEGAKDYKFFCFNGIPRIIFTMENARDKKGIIRRMYTTKWDLIPVGLRGKKPVRTFEKRPEQLEEMLDLARRLSEGIPFVRVDLYVVKGKVYFGEFTFFHMSGYETFDPPVYDKIFGGFLRL